ncbi:MAG: TrpR-related protein YerC/YecD [Clostridiales bacterium]|nr:TrpR-related protein YerC/YecD [Clostridiales bacterium]
MEHQELFEIIVSLDNVEDVKAFFDDLCTKKELASMSQRINAGRLLKNGETYESIIKKTGISSTTLSRVSTALKYGEGYKKFL